MLESERNTRTEAEIKWEKRCHASGFQGGRRGHMSSSVGQTGEQTVPRSRQKECSSVHTLIFAQRDPCWTCTLQNCKILNPAAYTTRLGRLPTAAAGNEYRESLRMSGNQQPAGGYSCCTSPAVRASPKERRGPVRDTALRDTVRGRKC